MEEPPLEEQRTTKGPVTPLPKFQIFSVILIQLAEAVNINILFPFVAFMVEDFGVNSKDLGMFSGGLAATFCGAQLCSSLLWGRFSDNYGRKPAVVLGTIGAAVGMIVFGLSKTYSQAVVGRVISGLLSGNLGVLKSFMTEITDETNRGTGFSYISSAWSIGCIIAPLAGGLLCKPATNFPSVFSQSSMFGVFPYFLPCLFCAIFSFTSSILCLVVMTETRKPTVTSPSTTPRSPTVASPITSRNSSSKISYSQKLMEMVSMKNITSIPITKYTELPSVEESDDVSERPHSSQILESETHYTDEDFKHTTLATIGSESDDDNEHHQHHQLRLENESSRSEIVIHNPALSHNINPLGHESTKASPLKSIRYSNSSSENTTPRNVAEPTQSSIASIESLPPDLSTHIYDPDEVVKCDNTMWSLCIRNPTVSALAQDTTALSADLEDNRADRHSSNSNNKNSSPSELEKTIVSGKRSVVSDAIRKISHAASSIRNGSSNRSNSNSAHQSTKYTKLHSDFSIMGDDDDNDNYVSNTVIKGSVQSPGCTISSNVSVTPVNPLRLRTVLVSTGTYGILCMGYILLDETIPLFLKLSRQDGGMEFSSSEIGFLLSVVGVAVLIFAVFILPKLCNNYPKGWLYSVSLYLALPGIFGWPMLAYFRPIIIQYSPSATIEKTVSWGILIFLGILRGFTSSVAFTAVTIQINHSVYDEHLGLVNGLGQTFASAARAIGPAIGGLLWTVSVSTNFVFLNFIIVSLILLFSVFLDSMLPSWLENKREPIKSVSNDSVRFENPKCKDDLNY